LHGKARQREVKKKKKKKKKKARGLRSPGAFSVCTKCREGRQKTAITIAISHGEEKNAERGTGGGSSNDPKKLAI